MIWKTILRWIAVIPAAAGGLWVGSAGMNLWTKIQFWLVGIGPNSGLSKIFYWIGSAAAGGALAVYWGAKTAPSQRKIVGSVIAGLVLIFAVLGFLGATPVYGYLWPLLSSLSFAIGGGAVMYQIFEDKNF